MDRRESTSIAMAEIRGLLRTPISLRRKEKYSRRKRREWKSIDVRKSVYDIISFARKNTRDSRGDVIARWARVYVQALDEIAESEGMPEGRIN